jgi:predicted solute-binding protein
MSGQISSSKEILQIYNDIQTLNKFLRQQNGYMTKYYPQGAALSNSFSYATKNPV